jgi:hypothetical protein
VIDRCSRAADRVSRYDVPGAERLRLEIREERLEIAAAKIDNATRVKK